MLNLVRSIMFLFWIHLANIRGCIQFIIRVMSPVFLFASKSYVECFFGLKIKAIQSNWGGEYRPFTKILQSHGISHRVSCPHMHQQNGVVELKHRHIVEIRLALLYHANMPLHFWDDAFSTTYYLINRTPTVTLKNKSPYEVLFKCNPNYKFLRIFGCACWPNLRPYNANKFQPRSSQCIFLGYSPRHKRVQMSQPCYGQVIYFKGCNF